MFRYPFLHRAGRQMLLAVMIYFSGTVPCAGAFPAGPGRYRLRMLTEQQALPHNTIHSVVKTADGYIWIGTDAGLARWDGLRLTSYTRWNTPALKNDRILSLHEDSRGRLWIGTDGNGLCFLRQGEIHRYMRTASLQDRQVRAIASDWHGYLWAGTDFGLYRLSEDEQKRFTVDDGLPDNIITALALDSTGSIWAGTLRGGAARFDRELVQVYSRKEGLTEPAVLSLAADRGSQVWIGTMQGLYAAAAGSDLIRQVTGLGYTPVTAVLPADDGSVWVGTMADSLKRLDNGSFSGFPGFPGAHVTSLCAISGELIAAGTKARGMAVMQPPGPGMCGPLPGMPPLPVTALLADRDGTLWAGTREDGVYRLRGGTISGRLTPENGLPGSSIRALMRDSAGNLWAGDAENGAVLIGSAGTVRLPALDGEGIYSFFEDADGIVWIAAAGGAYRYDAGIIEKLPDTAEPRFRVFAEAGGSLYAGGRTGLYQKTGSGFQKVEPEQGDNSAQVLALCADDTVMWIGTAGSGLQMWNNSEYVTFAAVDGLPDNFIYTLTLAPEGHLWMSCRKGVFSLHPDTLAAYAAGRLPGLDPVWLDDADGLPAELNSGAGSPGAVLYGPDSLLYVAAEQGIAVVPVTRSGRRREPPRCLIESVQADGVRFRPVDGMQLPAGVRQLGITVTGFDYGQADKLRFYYRLAPHESGFSLLLPGEPRRALYRGLPSGAYRFEVYAVGSRGGRSPVRSLALSIDRPFYAGPAFIAAVLVLAGLAAWLLIAGRHKQRSPRTAEKYRTTPVDPERADMVRERLSIAMQEDKIYLDPDLSLKSLSKLLKIHPNVLSRIINEHFGMSYNDYVNSCRIRCAAEKLASPQYIKKSIMDIMYESGFYSKSVFNTAFRKFTGETPSAFRKKHS